MTPVFFGILVFFAVSLLYLYYSFYKLRRHYHALCQTKEGTLQGVLDDFLAQFKVLSAKQTQIDVKQARLESELQNCFSHFSLVRFNPFSDLGGDQSFVLTLLSKKKNGVLLTSFHNRQGTRVYAKLIAGGGAEGTRLSKEEKDAILEAQKEIK